MGETVNIKDLYKELLALRKEVNFIKEFIVDLDSIMTPEEEEKFEKAMEEYRKGRTISLEDLKEELKL